MEFILRIDWLRIRHLCFRFRFGPRAEKFSMMLRWRLTAGNDRQGVQRSDRSISMLGVLSLPAQLAPQSNTRKSESETDSLVQAAGAMKLLSYVQTDLQYTCGIAKSTRDRNTAQGNSGCTDG